MRVRVLQAAAEEVLALPPAEQQAMENALAKLEVGGATLGFPHTSAVKAASVTLRELRPRRGRSPWRAFYRRLGEVLVVAAVGPDAQADARGFTKAVETAVARLAGEEQADG